MKDIMGTDMKFIEKYTITCCEGLIDYHNGSVQAAIDSTYREIEVNDYTNNTGAMQCVHARLGYLIARRTND